MRTMITSILAVAISQAAIAKDNMPNIHEEKDADKHVTILKVENVVGSSEGTDKAIYYAYCPEEKTRLGGFEKSYKDATDVARKHTWNHVGHKTEVKAK